MGTNSKYETREVVRARIFESTLQLLLDQSPADLTLRQIAQHAGCHHPDIATYFGGKAGLYEEVFPFAVMDIAARGLPNTFEKPSPSLIRLIRLAAWLEDNNTAFLAQATERSLFDVLTANYMNRFNLDNNTARLLVQRLMALVITAVLHPGTIGLKESHFARHFALEIQIAELLGQRSSNSELN